MDERQSTEMIIDLTDSPDFFQSDEGRAFFEGTGPIKSEKGPNKLAFILFGVGVLLFGSFLYMINTGVRMSGLVFAVTVLGGMFGVLCGGIWAFTEATTKPVIRTGTHVISGTVSKKKFMRKVGMWQVKADFTSPETGKTKKAMFILLPKDRDIVHVDQTQVAIIYSSKYDQGVVL